jgi:hypothetical protein
MENSKKIEKIIKKTREEKLAELILKSGKSIRDLECPFLPLIEKSFIERVLWLEDQNKEQLDNILKRCSNCGKCNWHEAEE